MRISGMNFVRALALGGMLVWMAGCGETTVVEPGTPSADASAAEPVAAEEGTAGADSTETAEPAAAPAAGEATALTPENTKIQFVGIHSGDKPDPRTGTFEKFTGEAKIDAAAGTLSSVSVDIDTTSLKTDIEKLTDHLKSADFFNVNEHPTAKFASTKIEAGAEGQSTITGNLTLLGVTKEISFPAKVVVQDGKLSLQADFTIDRSEFGMTYGEGKVDYPVKMTVSVGS
ncbi:MAG: YceI family protein [Pirellulaceae bacterium]|nr:YceI family protein [Pirellulaceae bacterium]